jgi:peptidoglycan/xylan/chitin deacetylase (PgdA/CDA1 family)
MPLRAILRATLKNVGILAVFGGFVFGAFATTGTTRFAFVFLAILAALAGTLFAYIYVPGFDPFARIPWRGSRTSPRIAITFDDGPNEPYTSQILDTLARHGAKATFFLLGRAVELHPEVTLRIVAEGHAIGSHTYSHAKLHTLAPREIAREIDRGEAALREAGVAGGGLFRAPHGLKSPFLPRILRSRGLRLIAWTDGVWDTDRPGADVIAARAVRKLRNGEILLLHDGRPGLDRGQTAAALDVILRACRERGLSCVTVPELLDA